MDFATRIENDWMSVEDVSHIIVGISFAEQGDLSKKSMGERARDINRTRRHGVERLVYNFIVIYKDCVYIS